MSEQTPEQPGPPPDPPRQPGWGPPSEPQPPKPKRQFLVTKIAVGVAAGIALFWVGGIVLLGILLSSSATKAHRVTATTAAAQAFTPPDSAPADTLADQTPTTQAFADGKVGDTFTATADDGSGADFTVTKITTASYDGGTIEPHDSSFWEHPSHGLYLIVRLTVKGTGSTGLDINTSDFSVVAPDGQTSDEQTESDTWGQSLPLTSIHQGETRRGVIVFDVGKQGRHGKIAYDPNFSGDPIATWSY
jgi:Domain of unknown function (DUF4352)